MVVRSKINLLASNMLRMRTKFSTIHGMPEIYLPPFYDKTKQECLNKLKNVTDSLSKSELAQKFRAAKGFYTLEMAPPSSGEIKQIQDELKQLINFFKSGSFKNVTVNEAWLFILVATEVGLWFYLGETIGKWHIVGYKV